MGENILLDEHFVPVREFPNYVVSNYGRVINTKTNHELKVQHESNGDAFIIMYFHSVKSRRPLRRLVAEAFFMDYKPWGGVYLISDNQDDCSVLNITLKPPIEPNARRIRINELGETFTSMSAAAHRIHGSSSVISKCLMGMGKSHKGFTFSYVK